MRGLRPATVGLVIGAILARVAVRLLSGVVYGVDPSDVRIFDAATLILTVVAALAAYVPARRASRIDPVATLRAE